MEFNKLNKMNKILKYSLLVLFAAGILTACINKNARKNSYPATEIPEPPVGTVYTITELTNMVLMSGNIDYYNDTIFKDHCSVYGIVTTDEMSGNVYKASFIQERATGKAIELYMKSVTGYRIGDSVRVCLKGAVLGAYKGTPQIQNLNASDVIILENNMDIEPEVTTIAKIKSDNKVCQLVRLEDVQFVKNDLGKNWADANGYGERHIAQYNDNCVRQDSVMVRTSNYAAFAEKTVPAGKGYLTAIVTKYKNTWQLLVRDVSAREILMDDPRCDN